MGQELLNLNKSNPITIDSREVAEMMEKPHDQLMRSIRTYIQYLESAKMQSHEYFVESTYINSQNKQQPCYLLTKAGCEIVGNKMTGEKGFIFTAKYVKRFNAMEQYIQQATSFKLPQTYKEALLQLVEQVERNELLESENKKMLPKVEYHDKVLHSDGLRTVTDIAKDLGMSAKALNAKLHELGVIFKQKDTWYLYSEYQHLVPDICDYHIHEHGQTLKWTEKGRQWIIEFLDNN